MSADDALSDTDRPPERRFSRRRVLGTTMAAGFGISGMASTGDPEPPGTPRSPQQIVPGIAIDGGDPGPGELHFTDAGTTSYGQWTADVTVAPATWTPSAPLTIQAVLRISNASLQAIIATGVKVDGFVLLVTAERTFDADGIMRLPSDERMSTLHTPTGLPIEGGVQGAVTKRFAYGFRTPVDQLTTVLMAATRLDADTREVTFKTSATLPPDLPPGIYRLRLDYGLTVKARYYNLNAEAFATRGFPTGPCDSETYSPPLRASGTHVSGRVVNAATIVPRIPWDILANYNSNGYRGVVADEDAPHFGLSSRNLIQDDVILPLYDENNPKNRLSYSLEPQFPTEIIFARQNIPWDPTTGQLTVSVTQPGGAVLNLGTAPFVRRTGQWLTTGKPAFTRWTPAAYGQYTVKATGWTQDIWGNRYEGGGTYHFWIAKRMTLATATFQGQAYPVGNRYGRDIGFSPAVPADVRMTATLYVNSDPSNPRTVSSSGKASAAGVFGVPQGMKQLPFDAPGEYSASVFASYTDADNHLWVESMRHAGVIYPPDTPIVANGKKLKVKDKYLDRGEEHFEGWHNLQTGEQVLDHVNFPYNSGDALLIAAEGNGANKIVPVLTWTTKDSTGPYDTTIQPIGITNVRLQTSNGYSPHLFPEYITDWMYFYAGAPRPGFMGRFIVAESGTRAPYWPTTNQNFGGQYNASSNGDAPGVIYRLLGGVVIRKASQSPLYAGYLSNAFTLPGGSNDNRVIAPGDEEIMGSTGVKARAFIAMNARPGMVYEAGTTFAPALQIDPMVPLKVAFTLNYPDGRKLTAEGVADATGSFAGKDRWVLDVPGVYRYSINGDWSGYKALVPGLPDDGGEMYVIEGQRPPGAGGIVLNLPPLSKFDPAEGLMITGTSTAKSVRYAVITPGAVLMQGALPVTSGRFSFPFAPAALHNLTQTYPTTNRQTGKPELASIVHVTFFSEETWPATYHSFTRVIFRGNTVHYTR